MNQFYSKLLESYSELQKLEEFISIKCEFEAEGSRLSDILTLANICSKNSTPLTLKIGGPFAYRDMFEAIHIGVSKILIPMVESSFALENSINNYLSLISNSSPIEPLPEIAINIESKLSIDNFKELLDSIIIYKYPINNIVIGRSDLSSSLDINQVDSDEIFNISNKLLYLASTKGLIVTIGGNITLNSFDFIYRLCKSNLHSFETRKCTFRVSSQFTKIRFYKCLKSALAFELSWLKYKRNISLVRSNEDALRIKSIEIKLDNSNLDI